MVIEVKEVGRLLKDGLTKGDFNGDGRGHWA
jgi:hypothetical protein